MLRRREIGKAGWGWSLFAGVISLIYFFPVLWIILTAFKTRADTLATPPKLFFTPTLDNFVSVFSRTMVGGQESTRSTLHLAELIRLANDAGLFTDPEAAAARARPVFAARGVEV